MLTMVWSPRVWSPLGRKAALKFGAVPREGGLGEAAINPAHKVDNNPRRHRRGGCGGHLWPIATENIDLKLYSRLERRKQHAVEFEESQRLVFRSGRLAPPRTPG